MKGWLLEVDAFLQSLSNHITKQEIGQDAYCWYLPEIELYIVGVSINSQILIGDVKFLGNQQNRIVLWQDMWHSKPAVVKSRLKAMARQNMTIPARLTKVRRIDKYMLDTFLKANHLNTLTTAKFKYGLFLPKHYYRILKDDIPTSEEWLVAVASFSGGKKIERSGSIYRSYELIRFCNVLNYTVVGGLDKLLKAFIADQNPDDVMTYADRDWSNGASYEKLGFERVGETLPQKFYINIHTLERSYEPPLNVSFKEIYNTGNWKYLLKLKKTMQL